MKQVFVINSYGSCDVYALDTTTQAKAVLTELLKIALYWDEPDAASIAEAALDESKNLTTSDLISCIAAYMRVVNQDEIDGLEHGSGLTELIE